MILHLQPRPNLAISWSQLAKYLIKLILITWLSLQSLSRTFSAAKVQKAERQKRKRKKRNQNNHKNPMSNPKSSSLKTKPITNQTTKPNPPSITDWKRSQDAVWVSAFVYKVALWDAAKVFGDVWDNAATVVVNRFAMHVAPKTVLWVVCVVVVNSAVYRWWRICLRGYDRFGSGKIWQMILSYVFNC